MYHARYSLIAILYSVVLSLTKADLDTSICNGSAPVVPPPLPPLSLSYYGVVEWKLLHENSTISVQEYKDAINKVSSLHINMKGENIQIIFDETAVLQMLRITKDGCTVSSIISELTFAENQLWLTPLTKLYNLMKQVQYKGTTTIRSTEVQQWHACLYLYEYDITLQIDMYFSNIGWAMALSPPTEMAPVRVEIQGTAFDNNTASRKVFHVVGDYVNFKPTPDFDQQMVQPPPGVFCEGRYIGKPILSIPSSFTTFIEKIDMDYKRINYQTVWFDAEHRFIRYDDKEASGTDPDPTSVVSDFTTGIKYNMDRFMGTCRPYLLQHGDDFVVNAYIQNSPAVEMIDSLEYFHIKRAEIIYVGKRKARNTYCDVWSGIYYDYDLNKNVTVEWYFTEAGWTEAVENTVNQGTLIKMDVWEGGSTNPVVHNILKLDPTVPNLSVFNLATCYPPDKKIHFVIKFEVVTGGTTLSSISYYFLKNTLQDNLAKAAFINAPRFADVVLEYSDTKNFFFIGTLLDKAPLLNPKIFPPPQVQYPVAASYGFLHGLITGDWMFNITSAVGELVTLKGIDVLQIPYAQDFLPTTTSTKPSTEKTPPIPGRTTPAPPKPLTTTPEPTPPFIPIGGTTRKPSTTTQKQQTTVSSTANKPCSCSQMKCPTIPTSKSCVCPRTTCPKISTSKPCVCPKTTCPKQTTPAPPISCPPIKCSPFTQFVTKPPSNTAKPIALKSNGPKGVSSGGVAGIAIAMIIVGIFFGMLGTVIYLYKVKKIEFRRLLDPSDDNDKY